MGHTSERVLKPKLQLGQLTLFFQRASLCLNRASHLG